MLELPSLLKVLAEPSQQLHKQLKLLELPSVPKELDLELKEEIMRVL